MRISTLGFALIGPPVFAACMVDPVTKPLVTSPYGVFRTVNGPVHQGFDIVSTVEAGERTRLLAAAQAMNRKQTMAARNQAIRTKEEKITGAVK